MPPVVPTNGASRPGARRSMSYSARPSDSDGP
ncbi:hypothetical protein Ae168Ps1_4131 [Pseudonocardia sp. Ae168_Ps1]|nr:hypothetical protein Ae150APs1_4103 [Pseudonocardia sp. Ae150A_Ps1]OLL81725.1 hypothetical protein Ae168Ps1_4131 [Pseudonocardia sp. Ae168_Ps1]